MILVAIVVGLIRLAIIGGLALVLYKQIVLLGYRAPRDVYRLKILLIALTGTMILFSVIALLQNVAAVLFIDELRVTLSTAGDAVYVISRLVGDIIMAGIIYLIYKEAQL